MVDKNSIEELQLIQNIMNKVTSDNKDIVEIMLADKTISNELMLNILNSLKSPYKINIFNPINWTVAILQSSGIMGDIKVRDTFKSDYTKKLLKNTDIPKEIIPNLLQYLKKGNSKLVDAALNRPDFNFYLLPEILKNTLTEDSFHAVANGMAHKVSAQKVKFAESLINNPKFPDNCIADVVRCYATRLIKNEDLELLCNNPDFPPSQIHSLIINMNQNRNASWYSVVNSIQPHFKTQLAKHLIADKNCPNEYVADIIGAIDLRQKKLFEQLYADKNISKEELSSILTLEYGLKLGYKNLTFLCKTMVLIDAVAIKDKTLVYIEKYGINKNKVDALVDEISTELGLKKENIYTNEENKRLLFNNYIANNSNIEEIVKNINLNKYKKGIPIKYSRSEFVKDIDNLLAGLSKEERTTVLNYFSLQIENGKMEGFPINPEKSVEINGKLAPIVEQIKKKVADFTQNNETTIENHESKRLFDSIIKGCPEFTTVIGKVQHETHQYTVDVHTLKVLQNAFNDPEYKKLDDESKTVLKFAILLHDLGKKEGVIDKKHYETSAKYAVIILEKYKLPTRVKSRIIETIYNHHWFEYYNKNEISINTVNALYRTPQDLRLAVIMAKADLMGVSNVFHLRKTKAISQKAFDEFFNKKMNELFAQQDARYKNANLVIDTKFVQTSERKFPTQTVVIKGKPTEIPVLNLTDESLPEDLYEFGFTKGTTRQSARFFSHFNNRIRGLKVFIALSSAPATESVQSLTMISLDNSRSYRHQIYGVITDVDMANIAQASNKNIGSGYKKDLKNFTKDLFSFLRVNTFVRDCLIEELHKSSIELTKDEYAKLAEEIVNIQYETQITKDIKIGDKVISAKVLQDALNASRDRLFEGSFHSEIVAINPRVKALVARVSSIKECSQEFLELAVDNNLPIILI